jgi:2-polyprenyl-3-methyl-5-hydroxy-6-metoxy-1,4-benzoquinol methylase
MKQDFNDCLEQFATNHTATVASEATVVPVENIADHAVKTLPFTWERLIPNQIAPDPASQRLLEISFLHYEIAARYVRNQRVLDIACGAGYGSQILQQAGASTVVGVDVSPESVGYAKQQYQVPGLEFVCADADQFNWPERFDVVVSFQTLEHVDRPDQFLDRIHRLLAPQGQFFLSVPLYETRHIDPYHLHAFNQQDIFLLLEQSGFSVEFYRVDQWHLTRADLLRWINLYPDAKKPTISELFSTRLGWVLMRDFVFRAGVYSPIFLVSARAMA